MTNNKLTIQGRELSVSSAMRHYNYILEYEKHLSDCKILDDYRKTMKKLYKELLREPIDSAQADVFNKAVRFRYSSFYLTNQLNAYKWIMNPSFRLYKGFLKYLSTIDANSLIVYLFLNLCGNETKNEVIFDFMSEMVLEKLFDLSKSQVERSLKKLEDINLITITTNKFTGYKKIMYIDMKPYNIVISEDGTMHEPPLKGIRYLTIPRQLLQYYNKFDQKGAIILYLYTCFHVDYKKGFHFRSIETMANELGVSHYTINKWIKELLDNKLIARYQTQYDASCFTYLCPIPKLISDLEYTKETVQELTDLVEQSKQPQKAKK